MLAWCQVRYSVEKILYGVAIGRRMARILGPESVCGEGTASPGVGGSEQGTNDASPVCPLHRTAYAEVAPKNLVWL